MNKVIKHALLSIKEEINLFPCLGLVSKKNSGSHKDMNFKSFNKSFKIFKPYLEEIFLNKNNILNFSDLQRIGYKYELIMFKKTNNINTHKGLIFALGIFFFSYLKTNDNITEFIKIFCKPLLKINFTTLNSIGSNLYTQHNIKGARHTAIEGYKVVFDILDFYNKNIINLKLKSNFKKFTLLLKCVLEIDDTTLINKIGIEQYNEIKTKISNLLNKILTLKKYNKKFYNEIINFNNYSISNNISPGGAADIFVLVNFLIKEIY